MIRNQIDLYTRAEAAIRHAVQLVEAMPADVGLTNAVVSLGHAQDYVGRYVEKAGISPVTCKGMPHCGSPDVDQTWRNCAAIGSEKVNGSLQYWVRWTGYPGFYEWLCPTDELWVDKEPTELFPSFDAAQKAFANAERP